MIQPASLAAVAATAAAVPPQAKKKMFKNCDFCRSAKRACDATYVSIGAALASKIACSNCKRKNRTCTFNHLISTFGVADLDFSALKGETDIGAANDDSSERRPDKRRRHEDVPVADLPGGIDEVIGTDATLVKRGAQVCVLPRSASPLGYKAADVRIATNLDRIFLNEDLVNIYEGAAEQALRCWVTNTNTPYLFEADGIREPWAGKTLHWKVCVLDQEAQNFVRGPQMHLASSEKAVREALHAVMLAFAAQWPRHRQTIGEHSKLQPSDWPADEARIRLELWKRARDKLMAVADVWSFRIIFALILFAWTEKPKEVPAHAHWQADDTQRVAAWTALYENSATETSTWQDPAEASTMMLATAGRKLLQFRNRLQSLCRRGVDPWSLGPSANGRPLDANEVQRRRLQASLLEKTYHNLFWLGVMIDTETAVLRKHPPVICDDDTDLVQQSVLSNLPGFNSRGAEIGDIAPAQQRRQQQRPLGHGVRGQGQIRKIWDEVILSSSQQRQATFARIWPSSEEAALRTLAFSAPVKVLLFRHIGRLQAAYWRQADADVIERHIQQGLEVVHHWYLTYQPFLESCIVHHSTLPLSIQSWYTLITVPWNLAVLLLVELAQTVDQACLSDPQARRQREQGETFGVLRKRACNQTAALVHAVQTHERQERFAAQGQGTGAFAFVHSAGGSVLHTEPWAEIMVCSFSALAKSEIRMLAGLAANFQWQEIECARHRIEKYLWALQQLSNRSHLAELAYKETKALADFCSPGRGAPAPTGLTQSYAAPPLLPVAAPLQQPQPPHAAAEPNARSATPEVEAVGLASPNTQLWNDCLAVLSNPLPTSSVAAPGFPVEMASSLASSNGGSSTNESPPDSYASSSLSVRPQPHPPSLATNLPPHLAFPVGGCVGGDDLFYADLGLPALSQAPPLLPPTAPPLLRHVSDFDFDPSPQLSHRSQDSDSASIGFA
ncbi:hypothetical protein ACQY0O_005765 [Thecaphora frezii]